ncbi:MAG: prepilin-type N-terminal cleavage/methylation domain-containing protein [Sedimentisphaerales bacterium]
MKKAFNTFTEPQGFSLAEVLTALVIASMVLVTVLGIYSRAESVSATITRRFDSSRLSSEVLQRIAEDLDRIIASDAYTTVSIKNKFEKGFPTAQLIITKTIVDARKKAKIFEHIIWQTNYDFDTDSLVLYRHRTSELGLWEDKLLDEERESWEQDLFVPICDGITFFKIQAVKNGELLDKWTGKMPLGIGVTISFAEPFKTLENTWDVFDEQKFTRVIAIDRTRKIKFKIAQKKPESPEELTGLEDAEALKDLENPETLKDLKNPEALKDLENPKELTNPRANERPGTRTR